MLSALLASIGLVGYVGENAIVSDRLEKNGGAGGRGSLCGFDVLHGLSGILNENLISQRMVVKTTGLRDHLMTSLRFVLCRNGESRMWRTGGKVLSRPCFLSRPGPWVRGIEITYVSFSLLFTYIHLCSLYFTIIHVSLLLLITPGFAGFTI